MGLAKIRIGKPVGVGHQVSLSEYVRCSEIDDFGRSGVLRANYANRFARALDRTRCGPYNSAAIMIFMFRAE